AHGCQMAENTSAATCLHPARIFSRCQPHERETRQEEREEGSSSLLHSAPGCDSDTRPGGCPCGRGCCGNDSKSGMDRFNRSAETNDWKNRARRRVGLRRRALAAGARSDVPLGHLWTEGATGAVVPQDGTVLGFEFRVSGFVPLVQGQDPAI